MRDIDLAAYEINIEQVSPELLQATVTDLPGCVAVGRTATELKVAVAQAIVRYLDEHPEAPDSSRRRRHAPRSIKSCSRSSVT